MTNVIIFPSMAKAAEDCPNRIREWRERRGRMSGAALAARTGISQQHLSRIETGKKSPSLDQLDRIASALEVNVGDLLHPRQNPDLPTPRMLALMQKLEAGGEQALRTAEAVADAQRGFAPQRPDIGGTDQADEAKRAAADGADQVA